MSPKLVELFLSTEQQIQLLELYFGGEILHGISKHYFHSELILSIEYWLIKTLHRISGDITL